MRRAQPGRRSTGRTRTPVRQVSAPARSFGANLIAFTAAIMAPIVTVADDGGRNLAAGKSYTISPKPNYKHCTDAGDLEQLTDGARHGANWTHKGTVGWQDALTPPTIVIDLGKVASLDAVRISTVGGGHAGVFFPSMVLIMVSDDGLTYRVVSTINRPRVEPPGRISPKAEPYLIQAAGLQARGRYVLVSLQPNQRFLFVDEIEVIAAGGEVPPSLDESNTCLKSDIVDMMRTVRKHARAVKALARFSREASGTTETPRTREDLKKLRQLAADTRAYVRGPVDAFNAALDRARGAWLGARWKRSILMRPANPMRSPAPDDVYGSFDTDANGVNIELWQGEYESAAIDIVNASPDTAELHVALSPLRGEDGRETASRDVLTMRRAVFVETTNADVIGDALVRIKDGRLPVEAGSMVQLWLTAHEPSLEPGTYRFAIRVDRLAGASSAEETAVMNGRLLVNRHRFPQRVALNTVTWGYLNRLGMSPSELGAVVDDFRTHYNNVYVVPGSERPGANVAPDGGLRMDFTKPDEVLRLYPDARRYLFLWGYTPGRRDGHALWGTWMSAPWKAHMRTYLIKWVAHLQERGVGYDRFAMYPYDESLCEEFYDLARLIKEVDPRIQIYANSPGRRQFNDVDRFKPYVDIWCFPETRPFADRYRPELRRHGAEVWRYNTTGDAKSLSPYGYYRLQPWRAWAAGDTGAGFWFYATGRNRQSCSDWDDFTCGRGRWAVVYDGRDAPVNTGGEVVIPSRRWEAWREGIEDYEYLHTLQSLLDQCRAIGLRSPAVINGATVLGDVVNDVLGNTGDPDLAYTARRRIGAAIAAVNADLAH